MTPSLENFDAVACKWRRRLLAMNTIELFEGNNVVPRRSDTIRLVQNGCSFYGLRSEDPKQHLKDLIKLVDSLDLNVANRERTRLCLFQFSLLDQASNWLEAERRTNDEATNSAKENVTKNKDNELVRVSGSHVALQGTPFLTTAKAMIKFDSGTITLRSVKSKISFHRIPEPNCKIKKDIKNDIEPITPTMTVNRLVLKWEEKIKLHQEKEMKFDQWMSKIFNNERLTSIKEECEVKNKG
nr:MAK10-like protein [Tanacetum cinerariifolium]